MLAWYVLHPLSRNGVNFWGGIGSDFSEVTLVAALLVALRHHQCHVDHCLRLGHHDDYVGRPACGKHHSLRRLHGKAQ